MGPSTLIRGETLSFSGVIQLLWSPWENGSTGGPGGHAVGSLYTTAVPVMLLNQLLAAFGTKAQVQGQLLEVLPAAYAFWQLLP